MVTYICKLTASCNSFFSWHQTDCWVMQTFPIRLIPCFFPLKAAVILASWGWTKAGRQSQEHRIRQACSHCWQARACAMTWSHCAVIALPCAVGQQVLVTSVDYCCLLSVEHSSAQISFLAAAHLADLVVVFPQIQTDQFLLPTMVVGSRGDSKGL